MSEVSVVPDLPYITFRLQDAHYGLHSLHVREVLPVSSVVALPGAPPHVRGLINLRGRTLTLVDTRVLYGMRSLPDELRALAAMMGQREQDHRNWLAELEACVQEGREFRLQLDPHQCAFGKWYDAFRTDNSGLAILLMRFDLPHRHIHAVGQQVIDLMHAGDREAARNLIERTRKGALSAMIDLFQEFQRSALELSRELAIVLEYESQTFAIVADAIESAESLGGTLKPAPNLWGSGAEAPIEFIAERAKDKSLILIPSMRFLAQAVKNTAS